MADEKQDALQNVPDVTLLLGADASGKDYVANILAGMIREAGGAVQKRRGFLSSRPCASLDSTNKGWLDYAKERAFLLLYPHMGFVMPRLVDMVLRWDLRRFEKPNEKLIIVGHHALRAMAFHLGAERARAGSFSVPDYFGRSLAEMRAMNGFHTIVLDISPDVRADRFEARGEGKQDYFDRYMAQDPARSERIEDALVWLAQTHLGAAKLENNNLNRGQIGDWLKQQFQPQI